MLAAALQPITQAMPVEALQRLKRRHGPITPTSGGAAARQDARWGAGKAAGEWDAGGEGEADGGHRQVQRRGPGEGGGSGGRGSVPWVGSEGGGGTQGVTREGRQYQPGMVGTGSGPGARLGRAVGRENSSVAAQLGFKARDAAQVGFPPQ